MAGNTRTKYIFNPNNADVVNIELTVDDVLQDGGEYSGVTAASVELYVVLGTALQKVTADDPGEGEVGYGGTVTVGDISDGYVTLTYTKDTFAQATFIPSGETKGSCKMRLLLTSGTYTDKVVQPELEAVFTL